MSFASGQIVVDMTLNKTLQTEGFFLLGPSPLAIHPNPLFKYINKLPFPFHLEERICNYTFLNTPLL